MRIPGPGWTTAFRHTDQRRSRRGRQFPGGSRSAVRGPGGEEESACSGIPGGKSCLKCGIPWPEEEAIPVDKFSQTVFIWG